MEKSSFVFRLFGKKRCEKAFEQKFSWFGENNIVRVRKQYGEFAFDDAFARRDGFRDHVELQAFGDSLEYADEEYDVIHFELAEEVGSPE